MMRIFEQNMLRRICRSVREDEEWGIRTNKENRRDFQTRRYSEIYWSDVWLR